MQLTKEITKELIDLKLEALEKTFGKPARLIALEIINLVNNKEEQTRFIEVSKWNKYHAYPTVSALRNLIYRSKTNGFDRDNVIYRKNGRLFINEKNFFIWFEKED